MLKIKNLLTLNYCFAVQCSEQYSELFSERFLNIGSEARLVKAKNALYNNLEEMMNLKNMQYNVPTLFNTMKESARKKGLNYSDHDLRTMSFVGSLMISQFWKMIFRT
eukprot:186120_1